MNSIFIQKCLSLLKKEFPAFDVVQLLCQFAKNKFLPDVANNQKHILYYILIMKSFSLEMNFSTMVTINNVNAIRKWKLSNSCNPEFHNLLIEFECEQCCDYVLDVIQCSSNHYTFINLKNEPIIPMKLNDNWLKIIDDKQLYVDDKLIEYIHELNGSFN